MKDSIITALGFIALLLVGLPIAGSIGMFIYGVGVMIYAIVVLVLSLIVGVMGLPVAALVWVWLFSGFGMMMKIGLTYLILVFSGVWYIILGE